MGHGSILKRERVVEEYNKTWKIVSLNKVQLKARSYTEGFPQFVKLKSWLSSLPVNYMVGMQSVVAFKAMTIFNVAIKCAVKA